MFRSLQRILRRLIVIAFYAWCIGIVLCPIVIAIWLLYFAWPDTEK